MCIYYKNRSSGVGSTLLRQAVDISLDNTHIVIMFEDSSSNGNIWKLNLDTYNASCFYIDTNYLKSIAYDGSKYAFMTVTPIDSARFIKINMENGTVEWFNKFTCSGWFDNYSPVALSTNLVLSYAYYHTQTSNK